MTDASSSQGNEVIRLIDAVIGLPRLDPESIISVLDIVMTRTSRPPNWEMAEGTFDAGPFRTAELSYRTDLGSGMLLLRAHGDTSLLDLHLDLDRFGPRPTPIPELSGPEGTSRYLYEVAGGTRTIELSFGALLPRFQGASVSWMPLGWTRPVLPGKERVWEGAPASIFLRSFDNVREVLEYALASRTWVMHAAGDVPEAHRTFGAFTREHDHVAGVFATPDGPAVFLDKSLMLVRPGETSVQLEGAGSNPHRSTFSLLHRSQPHQTRVLNSLIYEHRHGVGTNPYDTEREDVDLFALIATGLEREDFFRAYERDWRRPEGKLSAPEPTAQIYEHRHGVGTNPYDTEREDVDLLALIATRLEQEDSFRAYERDWRRPEGKLSASEPTDRIAGRTAGTEVRVCSTCGQAALVCVRLQPVSECLTATGWSDWRCQSCGASVRLYPQAGIRRLRWMAVPVFFTVVLPIWNLIRAHRLSEEWRVNPIASGAVCPAIRFPFNPKQRRCCRCSGVAELSELIQQCAPNGSPLGIRCRYRCKKCDRLFDFESPAGNILNVIGGILFGVGGLLALLVRPHGWDFLWGAVCVLLGAPLLWMAGSQFIKALRNPLIDPDG